MTSLERLVEELADAGQRLTDLGALEGAAGNISTFIPGASGTDAIAALFPESVAWQLPPGAVLPTGTLVITGTGRRLRDIARDPAGVLCAVVVARDGAVTLRRGDPAVRPTSEVDTHVGIHRAAWHADQRLHSVVHAQPPRLTWLSHVPAYRDFGRFNRQLYRWQPETLVMLPEGIGVVPFITPGTPAQGDATTKLAARHRLVVWAKHGVVAHVAGGPLGAADLIEYAEAAAHYEVLDIQSGRQADGLSIEELRSIAERFGIDAALLDRLPVELLP